MATRPAAKAEVNDWQNVEPNDWQNVDNTHATTSDGNKTQSSGITGFAKDLGKGLLESVGGTAYTLGAPAGYAAKKMGLVNESPEQHEQQENLFKPANATQAVGAGAGDALQAMIPVEKAIPIIGRVGKAVSEFAEPLVNKVSEFNQAWNPLPLRSRAVNAMKLIEREAKDVPVNMEHTNPAISDYLQHVSTGGEPGGPVMRKLAERIASTPEEGEVLFPEARQFYKNVGRESERPGLLRRSFEPRGMADARRLVGGAGSALKTDIGNAAETIGRGEDLANAMKEYASNAKLRKLGLIGAGVAGAEAARRSGLLGTVATKLVGQ